MGRLRVAPRRRSNIEHVYNNGVSSQVIFGLPTATCEVGSLAAHDCLTAQAALDQIGAVPQRHVVGRPHDGERRRALRPLQGLAARAGADRRHRRPASRAGADVRRDAISSPGTCSRRASAWSSTSPATARRCSRRNYGLYWHNPGVGVGGNANPNTADKSATYTWNDVNGDRRWQPGEERRADQRSRSQGAHRLDPNIKAPYTHEASVWVERQLTDTMGVRAGFVYKTEDDLITPNNYQPLRGPSTYTVPFTFVDIGVDGVRGTADDRNAHRCSASRPRNAAQFPTTRIVEQRRSVSRATRRSKSR